METKKKLEFQAFQSLRADLTYRIEEIESLQIELDTLKKVRQKVDAKISELNTKVTSSDEKSDG